MFRQASQGRLHWAASRANILQLETLQSLAGTLGGPGAGMPHLTDRRAIIKSGAALAAGALAGGAAQRLMFPFIKDKLFAGRGENIILYVADACRSDVIGKVIAGVEVTPNLNRLAVRGAWFSHCYAASNHTKPGMAAIISGEPPPFTGVTWYARAIPRMETISVYLKAKGFSTGAVVTNPFLSGEKKKRHDERITVGFSNGYDRYAYLEANDVVRDRSSRPIGLTAYVPDSVMLRTAMGMTSVNLSRRGARVRPLRPPFFLQLHSMRTHAPYLGLGPNEFTGRFHPPELGRGGSAQDIFEEDWRFITWLRENEDAALGQEALARLAAVYYEAAAVMDRDFGRLLDMLAERGFYNERTRIIFTADHGEALGGADKEVGHGKSLGEPALRVPLILSGGDVPAVEVSHRVPNFCILETLRSWFGDREPMSPSFALDPRSLASHTPVYAAARRMAAHINEASSRKVIRREKGLSPAVYDVAGDPGEREALAAGVGEVEGLSRFEAYCDYCRRERGIEHVFSSHSWMVHEDKSLDESEKAAAGSGQGGMTKQLESQLKALGYLN